MDNSEKSFKFKYLGMEWRFLKFEFEGDKFPAIFKSTEEKKLILNQNCDIEAKICLKHIENDIEISRLNLSSEHHQDMVVRDQDQSIREASFTSDDLILSIKNIEKFKGNQSYNQFSPIKVRKKHQNNKLVYDNFTPRPPEINKTKENHHRHRLNKADSMTEQIINLDIGKQFKM